MGSTERFKIASERAQSLFSAAEMLPSVVQLVTRMGLFGLGIPEVAVIAGIAVLVFGESRHSPFSTATTAETVLDKGWSPNFMGVVTCRTEQATRAWQGTGKEREELPDSSQGMPMLEEDSFTIYSDMAILGPTTQMPAHLSCTCVSPVSRSQKIAMHGTCPVMPMMPCRSLNLN